MAYPTTGGRGDAVVSVEWTPESGTFANWCGANNFSLNLSNEVNSTPVGDCDDWSKPAVNVKEYGVQNVTASMDATWSSAMHAKTSDWALNQKKLKVKVTFPNATTSGEVASYEGTAMLTGIDLANIGNVNGAKITENVTLEFDGTLAVTAVA